MARLRKGRTERPAAALVETAAVCTVFLLVLFGVFEYCRLLWVRQMVENAAREGARFAIVNSYDTNLVADTQAVINTRMSGLQNALLNWKVQVFHADANGNPTYQFQTDSGGNYVSDTKGNKTYMQYDSSKQQYFISTSGGNIYFTLNTANSTVNDNSSGQFATWASANNIGNIDPATNAAFGQYIAVQIDCDYNPIAPVLLWMNNTVHIQTKAFMCSEAN
jgi:Flp pilus assembly protein TadG